MKTVKIGFVGCGAISGIYLKNITNLFKEIEIIGVCDLIPERAESYSEKFGVEIIGSFEEARIALREAINALPEQERDTVLLRFFKGLTQQQCARILGVSQVQISRLERRALEKLRCRLR